MRKYSKYKDSGVEWIKEIPEHWHVGKLKFSDKIIMGQSPLSEDCNSEGIGMPFLQGNAEFGNLYPTPKLFCDNSNKIADVNDVLLSVRAPVGELNIANQKVGIGRGLCAIRSKKSHPKFIYYVLHSVKEELDSISTGSTFKAINLDDVKNIHLPLIAFEEQVSIVRYLNLKTKAIDALLINKGKLIALLKEERTAIISHAITKGFNSDVIYKDSGVDWIGQIPEHWQTKRVRYIFKISKQIAGELGHDILSVTQKGIKVKDIESGAGQLSMDYSKYQLVNKGWFIMNHMDLLTGYVDISKFQGVTSPDYRVFYLSEKYHPEYFLLHLQNCYHNRIFFHLGQGSAQAGRWRLPTINFNNFYFPIPPIEEQQQICSLVNNKIADIDLTISKTEKELNLLKEYKKVLISEVVTGKIDVREEVHI